MKPHMCPTCGIRLTSGKECPECIQARYRARQFQAVQELLAAVQKYQSANRRPPTVRELCVMLGLSSTSTVQARIARAVGWGLLEIERGGHRSLRVPRKETA